MNKKTKQIIKYCAISIFAVIVMGAVGIAIKTNRRPVHRVALVTAIPLQLPGGWGYKIEVNHRLYIYQNQVPCLPGRRLFPTRQSAMAVAEIVQQKIIQGRSPSVSKEEVEKAVPALNN